MLPLAPTAVFAVCLVAAAPLRAAESIIPAAELGLQLASDTTVVTGPLDAHGYPDYVAALNDRLAAGVSRDDNFWVLMWPVIGNAERTSEAYISDVERRLRIRIDRQPRLHSEVVDRAMDVNVSDRNSTIRVIDSPWSRSDFPEFAAWLNQHGQDFDQIQAACARPGAYAPLVTSGDHTMPMVAILLPHVQAMRHVARLLAARAMFHLGNGDSDAAQRDLLALLRLARHVERGPTFIEALVAYAVRSIALGATVQWIAAADATPEELDDRWAEFAPLLDTAGLSHAIDSERLMYVDTVLALLSRRATSQEMLQLLEPTMQVLDSADGGAVSSGQLRSARQLMLQLLLLGSDVNETLRYGNAMYDDLAAAMQPESHAARAALLRQIDERIGRNAAATRDAGALARAYLFSSREELRQLPAKALTGALLPAVSSVETAQSRIEAHEPLLRTAFRIRRHLASGEEFPLNLNEVQGLVAAEIADPFSDGPIRMVLDARGLVLYSVGPNGVDNSGRRPFEQSGADDISITLPIAP